MWNSARTYNPICPVHFAGFESDTLRLQRAGWQISAEQLVNRHAIRLALKFEPARVFALTNAVSMKDFYEWDQRGRSVSCPIGFHVQHIANDMRFQIMPMSYRPSFAPIDATPAFEERQEVRFEDLIPFRPLSIDAPEIVIAQADVSELLDAIIKKQDPKQKEIRERVRRDEWRKGQDGGAMPSIGYNPVRDIRAQIITLAS